MKKEHIEASLFNLYAASFCEPQKELADNLLILETLESLQGELNARFTEFKSLKETFLQYDLQSLLIDYTRVFIGPFHVIAYPYSSVYFSNGVKTLYNETTAWVEGFYRTCGFSFQNTVKDMPDHIAVELEFLYTLKFKINTLLQEGNFESAQRLEQLYAEFIKNHFSIWVPRLCGKVIDEANGTYYAELCKWLHGFITYCIIPTITVE
ncbi:MAG: molecular chaperone TorD family protein [Cyclobacteriaceae bacterium]|nr:molecular chaperone TorD family protein [Cyclobacteriaceae bacterium]